MYLPKQILNTDLANGQALTRWMEDLGLVP
jgi:hypothetical protein